MAEIVLSPAAAAVRNRRDWLLWAAASWLVFCITLTVLAPILPIQSPFRQDLLGLLQPPSAKHWFGTDSLGRDVFSRVVFGTRISIIVGIGSILLALAIGAVAGALAGYLKGRFDAALMAAMNVILAFPPLVLAIAIMFYAGPAISTLIVALGVLFIPAFARISRANTLVYSSQGFVLAAQAIGVPKWRILLTEVAPNLVAPLLSYSVLMTAIAMVAEGSLSFLGLSVPPPQPTLGGMISAERANLLTAPYAVFFPGGALFSMIIALNLVGERIQRRMDVRESSI
jgi:peptide/nickel transport system permease protein